MPTLDIVTALDETLGLPMKGKDGVIRTYEILPATAGQFIAISAMQKTMTIALDKRAQGDPEDTKLVPTSQVAVHDLILGAEVAAAMVADQVSAPDFQRATAAAFQWHVTGGDADAAARAWAEKPSPVG